MVTFSTLTGRLLDIELGSADSTVLFTTARRNAAINEGVREFAALTECWVRQASWTVTSTAYFYDMASTNVSGLFTTADFVRLIGERAVEFATSDSGSVNLSVLSGPDDLPQRTLQWYERYRPDYKAKAVSTSVEYPDSYWILRDGPGIYIGFSPKPSTGVGSSITFTANISYVAIPQTMSSGTEEPFSLFGSPANSLRPYHQAAVHYAAAQLEKLRKNSEGVQLQMQAFLAYVQRYLSDTRQKGGTFINTTRTYLRERRGGRNFEDSDPRT